jgi:proteasome assembly chaperone (PAC2) family protein
MQKHLDTSGQYRWLKQRGVMWRDTERGGALVSPSGIFQETMVGNQSMHETIESNVLYFNICTYIFYGVCKAFQVNMIAS